MRETGENLREPRISLWRIFHRDMLRTTIQTTLVIGSFMCIYYSLNFWYPTFLRDHGRQTLPYLAAFNIGAILGRTFRVSGGFMRAGVLRAASQQTAQDTECD